MAFKLCPLSHYKCVHKYLVDDNRSVWIIDIILFQRCPQGFRYNRDLNVCDDIDECADDTLHDCLVREGQVSLFLLNQSFCGS